MVQFIDNTQYCDNHPSSSRAFASRLRDSISESDILGYLAEELDKEDNCATVWAAIKDKLSSTGVKTARVYGYWQDIFGLKCEDMDNFLSF